MTTWHQVPICAPATPPLPSAVAMIRVSGSDLRPLLAPLVALPEPRKASLRWLCWEGFREHALVLYFPGPASYTGEDVVEFQIHGNLRLVQRLLLHLGGFGIRVAEPGEFTRRALLNGKQNVFEVEALQDLMSAQTDTQIRLAQARAGALPAWILEARQTLAPWVARAEASVDYGEDEGLALDLEEMQRELGPLRQRFHVEQVRSRAARNLRGGIRLALVGRPNAGKSTLFNALAGEDRAIVTDHPGTTRDVLEVRCEWRGLPLQIIDTAGLRHTLDPVERLGVARVGPVLQEADLILHLWPAQDLVPDGMIRELLAPFAAKTLEVRTFSDQAKVAGVAIDASRGDLDPLEQTLKDHILGGQAIDASLGALATDRQLGLLEGLAQQLDLVAGLSGYCPPELPASLLQGAWSLLTRLTGEDRAESTLDEVFTGLCLGK